VLHFKEGDPGYRFDADRTSLGKYQVSGNALSQTLRTYLFGPVTLKWFDQDKEMDVRIRGNKVDTLEELEEIRIINGENSSVPVSALGSFIEETGRGRINRINRQRAESFSIQTNISSLTELEEKIAAVLSSIEVDEGYGFRVDKKIERMKTQYLQLILAFLGAVIAIYLVLAAQYESLTAPIVIFLTIPAAAAPSLLFLFLSGTGLSVNALLGLIVVSGLVVNNCILLVDEALEREKGKFHLAQIIRHSLRKRAGDLVYTTGSTLFGLLPLILIPDLAGPLKELSFIIFLGIASSFIITMYILPGILLKFPFLIQRIPEIKD
jgi:HAE1 family hydrophobic/amphiphilic exporter-1